MTIERDDIKEIVNAVAVAGIEEFSLEVGDIKVRLRKRAAPAAVSVAVSSSAATAAPATTAPPTTAPPTRPAPATSHPPGLVAVTAPLIGTFYRSPAPGATPFVEVGTRVEPDDTVCIVEVMKLMNAVRAGCRGWVVAICADDGTLVEYGQTLMLIEPTP
jgi:acetyl-CoA carboxylase biotin carboxyl carrier protein